MTEREYTALFRRALSSIPCTWWYRVPDDSGEALRRHEPRQMPHIRPLDIFGVVHGQAVVLELKRRTELPKRARSIAFAYTDLTESQRTELPQALAAGAIVLVLAIADAERRCWAIPFEELFQRRQYTVGELAELPSFPVDSSLAPSLAAIMEALCGVGSPASPLSASGH